MRKLGRIGRKKWKFGDPRKHPSREQIKDYFSREYISDECGRWIEEHLRYCRHCSLIQEDIDRKEYENLTRMENIKRRYENDM